MQNYTENIYSILNNITGILVKKGIQHAVLCPGSRSAPIALTFLRNKLIKSYIINDERSAAYMALGIAQQTHKAVALISTSGTAAINFAAAAAEAFFQEIPLLILTADRPPEWIGQNENQTIFQDKLYEPNILKSFRLNIAYNDEDAEKEAYRIISEAVNISIYPVSGPVHINIPLREPLYLPTAEYRFPADVKIIDQVMVGHSLEKDTQKELVKEISGYKKIMIVAGLMRTNPGLLRNINKFLSLTDIVFVPDITSNLHGTDRSVKHPETIIKSLTSQQKEELKPDLLITFGGQIVSNVLKNYLREFKPEAHWVIDFNGRTFDSYRTLTKILAVAPEYFFNLLLKNLGFFKTKKFEGYFKKWEKHDFAARETISLSLKEDQKSELSLVNDIISHLPKNSILQIGNSLPIRYFNNLKLDKNSSFKSIQIFSNRGTSGIDGSLSTAVGYALATHKTVTVVLGDLSFFYDRNGLWNKYLPANLKIIILNNHGGKIFSKMQGPKEQPELQEYFISNQPLNAKETALQHQVDYLFCNNLTLSGKFLREFYLKTEKTTILEFEIN